MPYFLGIDGGQSHTTALVADARGRVLGRGAAGPSNHTREPGGRERLIQAVTVATEAALKQAGLLRQQTARAFKFASAHLAMTGEPEDKVELVAELLTAEKLVVDHDAPGALAGALAGEEGVIVLGGTGSVACGRTRDGKFVRVGGHGYLFGDAGGSFWIAREAVLSALRMQDRDDACALTPALLKHFRRKNLKAIIEDVYAGDLSRDQLAGFAARVGKLAEAEEPVAQEIINQAACDLAELAVVTALRLNFGERQIRVSYGGGVFRSRVLLSRFAAELSIWLSNTRIVKPRFGPDAGALLLAYQQAGRRLTPKLVANLEASLAEL